MSFSFSLPVSFSCPSNYKYQFLHKICKAQGVPCRKKCRAIEYSSLPHFTLSQRDLHRVKPLGYARV
jgi:hypothetical protein